MFRRLLIFIVFIGLFAGLYSQESPPRYYPETDPLVLEKLEEWQDLKFGLLLHWGPYSQWGIVESWSICSEDVGWTKRTKGRFENYGLYKIDYENLKTTFNPGEFNPEKWAKAAKAAGMKYVVFTTKHHDGFCMFDSKYTDYKITDKDSPFHTNPKSNITKEIFDAFREEGLWTGAYFSKPDWHSEYYWWPYFATPDRNVNYDIKEYPERWENFIQFTHNQIDELMTDYGKVDILWLDGGWVQPYSEQQLSAYRKRKDFKQVNLQSQDIRMHEIVKKAREKQPGLIVVDRAVEGPHQNYLTPENRVPETMLPYPWESCIIMGGGWSYSFDPEFMSSRELVHMLVDIVSKGGNLLLNIGPSPEGTWYDEAYVRLEELGKWMAVNNEAIYNSRPTAPYKEGNICLTKQKDGTVYAIYLGSENEPSPPSKIWLSSIAPANEAEISMLGVEGHLEWKREKDGFSVAVPSSVRQNPPCNYAWILKISGAYGNK
ncbi:MAG: alpha-L-fucosidase [Candidatus Aminicenantes bacterium]|nr:alpha-L-fucosidase [Candidatus Aminicenantes bacterium]